MHPTRELLFRIDTLIEGLRRVADQFEGSHYSYIHKATSQIMSARTDLNYAESHLLSRMSDEELNELLGPVLALFAPGLPSPFPNEDPRYPPEHPLSREKNEAARRAGHQVPKHT